MYASEALLGPHTQANPYVAMVTLGRFVRDPLVSFVLHSLRQVRLFLLQATSEETSIFFHLAASHTGEPLQVRGPAGALPDPGHEQILYESPHAFPPSDREALIQWSIWGAGLATALLQWLRGLQWPSTAFSDEPPGEQDNPGVSWLELMLDFEQAAQVIFPMNFAERQQQPKLRTPTIHQNCHHADMHMTGMLKSFQAAIKQIEKLLQQSLMPERRKVARTLCMLGSGHQPLGVAIRPVMWKPVQVQSTLDHPRTWTFEEPLTFSVEEPAIRVQWTNEEREPEAHDEHMRAKKMQQHLRALRNG